MARNQNVESNPASGEVRKANTDAATAAEGTDAAPAPSAAPKVMYPSELEGLQRKYNLTAAEAEQAWKATDGNVKQSTVDELKAGRVIYRVRYEQVPATLSNPLTVQDNVTRVADLGRAGDDEARQRLEGAKTAPTTDNTKPESGPHGPFADYEKVKQPAEELSEQTGVPLDVADEVAK